MKKTFTSIIAIILCAIITVTGISSETAYAADNTVACKIGFNGKTVKLSDDIEEGIEKASLKTLTKKWGKPNTKYGNESCMTYVWSNGRTQINYTDYADTKIRDNFSIDISDENGSVCGIKVGMKKSKAVKILKKLGAEKTEFHDGMIANLASDSITIECSFEKGKVSSISCIAYVGKE